MDRARAAAAHRVFDDRRVPAAPCRLLRGHGLAEADDEAGRDGVTVRAVLHLRPTPRRRQVTAAGERGAADSRARSGIPRARGDQCHRLDRLGRVDRQLLVRGRRRGAAANGGHRLRRERRRHLGAERALLGRAPGNRQRAGEHAGLPQRPLRRRRIAPRRARDRVHRGDRTVDHRSLPLPGAAAGLVRGCRLLERPEPVRERLVAGGLRRCPSLRDRGLDPGGPARPAQRVPAAPAHARGRRSRLGGCCAELPGGLL